MIKKLFAVLMVSFLAFSCQSDSISESTEALEEGSQLTEVLKAMSLNETDVDDFLDSTSCYKVRLPVQVIVYGQRIRILSESGYSEVLNALENGSDYEGADSLSFVFPVTLQDEHYSEVTVNNQKELTALRIQCTGSIQSYIGDDCAEIMYPITLYNYNSGFQMQGTSVVNNNQELYTVIKNLGLKEYYSVKYPVIIKISQESSIEVADNEALLEAINNALNACGQQG
ncbi:hypothetical protein R1T16_15765 [Flavobacterium sp. DG1-102-2]|uniref:hypothetical protein n=1 Tax=Flavobacterium sp. DG1-102-2 TaxID=3081663 RepID=UPI00294A785C|nr:hypothetical protein [Flavobacterium sp. DG1-102-2]MDV6169894.1 hypothetical protein [Flavobacterium sp. DG1-102-2]